MLGVKAWSTRRRNLPWRGGSITSSMWRIIASVASGRSSITTDPRSEEKIPICFETATTSACFITAQ